MLLSGQTAVVTGGSRGIGYEICKIFLEHGARVLAVSRDPSKLAEACDRLPELNTSPADVSRAEDVELIAEWVKAQWGKLDILINNAAVYTDGNGELTDGPDEVLFNAIRVNLFGPYLCTKWLLPLLLRSDTPRIVNVGSRSGVISPRLHGAYGISKTALHAMTIATANELQGKVAVNALSPGWVRTDMSPDAPGDPRTSAEAALFLVTQPESVTGKLFHGRNELGWSEP